MQGASLSAWCTDLQSRTPPRGAPLYADEPNNREWTQVREPSKCLNRKSYRERLAKEAFWLPATRGSKKDSGRAITPAADTVRVPVHLEPLGSQQAKQLYHFNTQPSLGQSCHSQSLESIYTWSLRPCPSLWPCGLWPARLLCQWGSSGKNTGAYWPILFSICF